MPNVRSAQCSEDTHTRTAESQREALRQRMREVQTWALALPGQNQAQSASWTNSLQGDASKRNGKRTR